MAEKSKWVVDLDPAIAKNSEVGDNAYRSLARALGINNPFLGTEVGPNTGTAPGPGLPWMNGTPIAMPGVQPMGPEAATAPFGMPVGPQLPPGGIPVPAARGAPPPLTLAAVQAAMAAKAGPPPAAPDLQNLPTLDISDLLPNRDKLAAALKDQPIDIRPIAAFMDSIYGTKSLQATPDLAGERLQKVKEAESMMGYSPALQQVIGQGRYAEFKAKLDKVMGAEEQSYRRGIDDRKLKLDEWVAKDNSRLREADIEIKQLKMALDAKNGKPLTEGQQKARLALASVMPSGEFLRTQNLEPISNDEDYRKYIGALATRQGVEDFPLIGKFGANSLDAARGTPQEVLGTNNPKLARTVAAMTAWVQAVTRLETGAVIGPKEAADKFKIFFPQRADSPDLVRDKARIVEMAEKAITEAAGL